MPGELQPLRQLLEQQPDAVGAALVNGLKAFLDTLAGQQPAQAVGDPPSTLGRAALVSRLDEGVTLGDMPRVNLERHRVTVNRPRPGRDGGEWCLMIRKPGRGREQRERTGLKCCPETRQQAEELARIREHELNNGKPTFAELWDLYTEHQRDVAKVAPRTLASYRASRGWLVKCGIASLTEDTLTRGRINAAKAELCKRLKNTSAQLKAVHWSGCWRWAYQEELVATPWPDTKRIRVNKADRCRKQAYTDAEVSEVFALFREAGRPRGRYLTFVWALAETGARADAMAHVQGKDLERDEATGGVWIRLAETKTGPERRNLVSPLLASQLPLVGPEDYVWSSTRNGEPGPLNYPNVTSILRRWLKERGLFGLRDLHSLRRTAAQQLQTGGDHSVEEGRRVTGQSAEVFMSYAGKGHYASRTACQALWLDPGGTQVQASGPTVEVRRGQALHSEHSEQLDLLEDTLNGLAEPSSPNTAQAETQVLSALRFVIRDGSGWPQALSIVQRCVKRLRSELPPTP